MQEGLARVQPAGVKAKMPRRMEQLAQVGMRVEAQMVTTKKTRMMTQEQKRRWGEWTRPWGEVFVPSGALTNGRVRASSLAGAAQWPSSLWQPQLEEQYVERSSAPFRLAEGSLGVALRWHPCGLACVGSGPRASCACGTVYLAGTAGE